MCKKKYISRRKFLADSTCAAMGSTAFLSSIMNLGMINTAAARPHIISNPNDYKAMVCILLAGGADSFNMLVPIGGQEYVDYVDTRGTLALDKDDPNQLLEIFPDNTSREFAVNAAMSDIKDMFQDGDLSFVSNIGTLVEPIIDANDYNNGNKLKPLGLYSHSDQIMQWQSSVPQDRSAVGVGGRMADLLNDMNSIPDISMNISLSGKNVFQSGNNIVEYSISNNTNASNVGFDGFPGAWNNQGFLNALKDSTMSNIVEQSYANIFESTFGGLATQNIESNRIMKSALQNVIPLNTTFSSTNLSQDLKKVAELIQVREHLGVSRQIFFITIGGWDHHDNVNDRLDDLLPQVNNALKEFNTALKDELNVHDKVVTFTISDFARTLTSNGNGSDHAWGGNSLIMGGPITGKRIFGNYPSLALNSNLNLSDRGRILPKLSVDEFYAEIALWFGVSPNDLSYILPNICNFYDIAGCPNNLPSQLPIGMFS